MTLQTTQQVEIDLSAFDQEFVAGSVKKALAGVRKNDLYYVDPDEVEMVEGFNARVDDSPENEAHIEALTQSMLKEGYYRDQPISIMIVQGEDGERRVVTNGHSRVKAARRARALGAPIQTIPAVTEDRSVSMEDLTVKLYRSNTGKQLSPYETGLVCKRLSRYNWETKDIAEKLNLDVQWVESLLMLVGSPRSIREAVIAGEISATNAIDVLKKYGSEAVAQLEKMRAAAQAQGSVKITARHSEANQRKGMQRALKKHGEELFGAISKVKSDPAYASLNEETRQLLEQLMAPIQTALEKDMKKAAQLEAEAEAGTLASNQADIAA